MAWSLYETCCCWRRIEMVDAKPSGIPYIWKSQSVLLVICTKREAEWLLSHRSSNRSMTKLSWNTPAIHSTVASFLNKKIIGQLNNRRHTYSGSWLRKPKSPLRVGKIEMLGVYSNQLIRSISRTVPRVFAACFSSAPEAPETISEKWPPYNVCSLPFNIKPNPNHIKLKEPHKR